MELNGGWGGMFETFYEKKMQKTNQIEITNKEKE